jgi:multicomponent Na+:H+ antiporter subunit F
VIDVALFAVAVFLLLNVVIGLTRAVRGPSVHDRLTAFLLLGTTGVALLAVLAAAADTPALRDAALAIVSLAAIVVLVRIQAEAGRR